MTLDTTTYSGVTTGSMEKYFGNLVNKIFKILPILETEESSIKTYLESLQIELEGCREMVVLLNEDPMYISLLSTLTWLNNHIGDEACQFKTIRREVFNAISICKKLERQMMKAHSDGGDS